MNHVVKGALAAAAAGTLLLGGAGSLAYWGDSETISGDDFSSGRLELLSPTGQWQLNGTDIAAASVLLVPGDTLTWAGGYVLDATGNNMQGTLEVDWAPDAGDLSSYVDTTTGATFDGVTLFDGVTTTFDESDDDKPIAVTISVDFPFGTTVANASQGLTVNLANIDVDLVQTDAMP